MVFIAFFGTAVELFWKQEKTGPIDTLQEKRSQLKRKKTPNSQRMRRFIGTLVSNTSLNSSSLKFAARS